jgi:hypothetical protein
LAAASVGALAAAPAGVAAFWSALGAGCGVFLQPEVIEISSSASIAGVAKAGRSERFICMAYFLSVSQEVCALPPKKLDAGSASWGALNRQDRFAANAPRQHNIFLQPRFHTSKNVYDFRFQKQ